MDELFSPSDHEADKNRETGSFFVWCNHSDEPALKSSTNLFLNQLFFHDMTDHIFWKNRND